MNKAFLISIQPKWCELIASGKKTIEVRRTRPKLETPFKCYMYMTKDCKKHYYIDEYGDRQVELIPQKVIGEFVCDRISKYDYTDHGYGWSISEEEFIATYLSGEEFCHYGNQKPLYGWHISDLKIYDKPKELGEFKTPPCEKDEIACDNCKHKVNVCGYYYPEFDCPIENGVPLTRPPQSWCYVEEI